LWRCCTYFAFVALQECAIIGRDAQRAASRRMVASGEDSLRSKGMLVSDIAPAELARIRAATQPVYDRYAQIIGVAVVERVTAELRRIRGQ